MNTKKIKLFSFFLLQLFLCNAQPRKELINSINKKQQYIDQWLAQNPNVLPVEIHKQCIDNTNEYEDVNPGNIKYYYRQKQLRLISVIEEDGVNSYADTKYYFWDNTLQLCYQSLEKRLQRYQNENIIYNTEVQEKRIYFSEGKPFCCLHKTYKESVSEEENQPYQNPFERLNSIPFQESDCDTLLKDISDITYYLNLLQLDDKELKEHCMIRN